MTLTDFERKLLVEFQEENGAPAGRVAQDLGVSTAMVTRAAKKLQAEGLLEDTGYAMKFVQRLGHWQYIDKPKTEGGMVSKPGASTVWRNTLKGHAAIGHEPSPYVTWKEGTVKAKRGSNSAESAGNNYAHQQLESEYFSDWVRDQLIEASKMPQDQVLPLETETDALVIAGKMLQQLEWDTKRDLRSSDIPGNDPAAFFVGFHKACQDAKPWLAEELLTVKGEMGLHEGRGVAAPTKKRDRRKDQYVYAMDLRIGDIVLGNSGQEYPVVSVSEPDPKTGNVQVDLMFNGTPTPRFYYQEQSVAIKRRSSGTRETPRVASRPSPKAKRSAARRRRSKDGRFR